jgi:hypothetical protein
MARKQTKQQIRRSVQKQRLSRYLYELPLELKVLIFQMAVFQNMLEWSIDHSRQFMEHINPIICKTVKPSPICEMHPSIKYRVNSFIPYGWLKTHISGDRYDEFECRDIDVNDTYWYDKRCWCKNCYDARNLHADYNLEMRHWFLFHQVLNWDYREKCRDFSEGGEKRSIKLDIIGEKLNKFIDDAPYEYWDYLKRNYRFDRSIFAYVLK